LIQILVLFVVNMLPGFRNTNS